MQTRTKTIKDYIILAASGALLGLCFAPTYFLPAIFSLSYLLSRIQNAASALQSYRLGYAYGFGFFSASLYWICYGPAMFPEFLWLVPFAFIGMPMIMANFTALCSTLIYYLRKQHLAFHLYFCLIWVGIEFLSTYIFTGFPWCLLGYVLTFSNISMQLAYLVTVYGLSFIVVYVGSSMYSKHHLPIRILSAGFLLLILFIYGYLRLINNPTQYTDINVRLVQASIPQTIKWNEEKFWSNLQQQIDLSKTAAAEKADIIIWPEAALTVPHYYPQIQYKIKEAFSNEQQILITGNVIYELDKNKKEKLYSSLIALNNQAELEASYHKAHLVPFGEYIPWSDSFIADIIPIKKITHGLVDYSPGEAKTIFLTSKNLIIRPLICYEAIFPFETALYFNQSIKQTDLLLNISNDSWYGDSAGPHQHLSIARMRAVETGIPLIRVASNGISAIIDGAGRIIAKLDLNEKNILDGKLPKKIKQDYN